MQQITVYTVNFGRSHGLCGLCSTKGKTVLVYILKFKIA